ncbi:ATP-binding protein [Streptomyces sp. NPDC058171]
MDPTNREPEQHDPDAPGNREAYEDVPDRHDQATSGARGQQRPEPVDGGPTTNRFLPAVREDRSPVPVAGRAAPPRPRPPRDPLTPDLGGPHPARRPARLVAGDLSLLVNPVDGSEIATCPPGERPGPPERHTAEAREEVRRAATPPVPAGPALARPPLLERQEEREHLVRLIARGGSVRLVGATGSGRTALLDAVAEDCADLAPDGVIRLTGFRRTVTDLFHDLYAAVFDSAGHRPDRATLVERVREIGAVVIVDDLSFGGTPLDELLDATPECAFLLAVDPDAPAPTADAPVEDVTLAGLSRAASTELLERATGRVLTEEESNWAGDLWFESEGLPLRFVQAGALLRQRDARRLRLTADDRADAGAGADAGTVGGTEDGQPDGARDLPLPSPAEAAAPAALLAADLSASARAALRFAVALDGEVPHQAHLPALVGDTHADAALAELAAAALVTPVGARHRLAAGVRTQLLAAGYPDAPELIGTAATGDPHALIVARHYAWWAGHPSVTPRRVAAEADAVLTALTAVASPATASAPLDPADEEGGPSAPVGLARAAAPVLAAGGDWNAWEAVLRLGVEAARHTGEVADEAYFHHELGVLALCAGQLGRARAELEASVALRGAVADRRGAVAGRRALALVTDRSGQTPAAAWGGAPGAKAAGARYEQPAVPSAAATRAIPLAPAATAFAPATFTPVPGAADGSTTLVSSVRPPVAGFSARVRRARRVVLHGTRRNLAAAGAGALLAAVLGTVVTLGMISEDAPVPADRVRTNPSASQGVDDGRGSDDGERTADADTSGDTGDTQNVADETDQRTGSTSRPVVPGATSATPSAPSTPQSPRPSSSGRPTSSAPGGGPTEPSSPATSTGTGSSPSGEPTPPASTRPPSSSAPPSTPTGQPTTTPPTTSTPPSPPAASSSTTDRSAGPTGPVRVSPPAEAVDGADAPDPVQ